MNKPALHLCLIGMGLSVSLQVVAEDFFKLSIEELMDLKVTAQKREQEWFETPLTVDVYDGQTLRERNINHFRELAKEAPGLVYGRVGNTPHLYLRGIGSDLLSVAADASTAVYADDVYLARPEMALAHFWDVERIEILKGPQGALYGRNATGGAINIIRTRPSYEQASGYARVTTGAFSLRQLEAAAGTPLGESMAVRASILAIKDDGYTRDLDPQGGDKVDDTDVLAGRAEWRWQISDALESAIALLTYRNDNHAFTLVPADHNGLAEQMGAEPVDAFDALRNNIPSYSHYQMDGFSWRWDWTGDSLKFQSVTAYRSLDTDYFMNTDGTEIDVTESQRRWSQDQLSQEFRLFSDYDGNWQWILGATWLDESPELDIGSIRHPQGNSTVIRSQADTTDWGIYGEIAWNFYPRWNATLGIRDSHEKRRDSTQRFSTNDLNGLDSDFQHAESIRAADRQESANELSPQFILSFTPDYYNANELWYFSATDGFKSGGANSVSTTPTFKSEGILSLEAGYKYHSKNIVWGIALFDYNYTDLQVTTIENDITSISNATSADVHGMDASFRWAIAPHWHWQISATGLIAHYKSFTTSLAGEAVDASDNAMPYAPQWDLNQQLGYTNPLPLGELHLSLHHHYQSKTYFNQFENNTYAEQPQHIIDVQATWHFNNHWEIGAGIMNLTDEAYYQNITRFTTTSVASAPEGNALGVRAVGRQWLVSLNYEY